MICNSLHLPYEGVGTVGSDAVWLNMVQSEIPEAAQNANLADINQMLLRAQSGLSAHSYNKTGLGVVDLGTVLRVSLVFYVYPSSLDLPYSLVFSGGTLSGRALSNMAKSGNVVFPLSDTVEFPYLIGAVSYSWESACYDNLGIVTSNPEVTSSGFAINCTKSVFGVLRVSLNAVGYRYVAVIDFQKTTATREYIEGIINDQTHFNSITNINLMVEASYVDAANEPQKTSLSLKLPNFISDYLTACENKVVIGGWEDDPPTTDKTTIYYSTCTGEILDRHTVEVPIPAGVPEEGA